MVVLILFGRGERFAQCCHLSNRLVVNRTAVCPGTYGRPSLGPDGRSGRKNERTDERQHHVTFLTLYIYIYIYIWPDFAV